MSLWDSMKIFFLRRRLLANQVPKDCEHPLEEWMAIKARATMKANPELLAAVGGKVPEGMTRQQFDEYQLFRFRKQMEHVRENTPHYREKYKGFDISQIRTYEDLQKVPFTLPEELAADPFHFFAESRTKMKREFTTTGTTGQSKSIGYTVNDLISKIDIIASALKDIGMGPKDSLHVMFPTVIAWDPSLMMVGACKVLGYGSSTCSETDIAVQMETMRNANTTFIIGLPSFIHRVTVLGSKDADLKSLGIKKIISTSEPLSESMRASLEEAWGCKVLDVWGMTEFGLACAVECDVQKGLHTDEANLLFEVIDPITGKHVPPGAPGELVVSSLNAEGTILLRYRTRDLAAMIDPPCPCGKSFNRKLRKPNGRLDMQFKIGLGAKAFPVLFDDALFSDPSVIDYQLEIGKDGFKDTLTFMVEAREQSDALAGRIKEAIVEIPAVSEGIQMELIAEPEIRFVEVGSMEYSAKAKKIKDNRGNFD